MRTPVAEAGRGSVLHRAPARVKLAAALVLLVGTALLPRRLDMLYMVPAVILLAVWIVSRMPLRYVWRRLLPVEPFILGIAVLSLLSPAAAPVFYSAIVKSNLCVAGMLLLTWTTSFEEILNVLRRLSVPSVMLTTITLMYRYLFVLSDEAARMQRARASRTFARGRGTRWTSLAAILGQLFVRSADRAERIYLAMCARGWK